MRHSQTSTRNKDVQEVKIYKSIKPITMPVAIIAVCFALGVADMMMLQEAMPDALNVKQSLAAPLALILATVANFTALLWGKSNGERLEKRSLNRQSIISFLLWSMIGAAYMAIRILAGLRKSSTGISVADLAQMGILAILYIGTGITISAEARTIFDANESEYRRRQKEFTKHNELISDEAADLQENIGKLKGYNSNYAALDAQYQKIKQSIRKAEAASMADIVGKTLKHHPEITSSEAHEVMDGVLRHRDEDTTK